MAMTNGSKLTMDDATNIIHKIDYMNRTEKI